MTWLQYHPEPVTLHSGGRSHWRINADAIFHDQALRASVLRAWRKVVGYQSVHNIIIAIPEGGIRWAEALASVGNLGWSSKVYVLREEWAGKYMHPGKEERLIVVDDVATTGASLVALVPHADVRLCVVDRSEHGLGTVHAWAYIPLPLLEDG